jgi:hypothetical protein
MAGIRYGLLTLFLPIFLLKLFWPIEHGRPIITAEHAQDKPFFPDSSPLKRWKKDQLVTRLKNVFHVALTAVDHGDFFNPDRHMEHAQDSSDR